MAHSLQVSTVVFLSEMEFVDILSVFKLDVMQFAETIGQCMKSEGVGDVTGKSLFRLSTDWMQQPLRYSPSVGRGRFNHKLVLDAQPL